MDANDFRIDVVSAPLQPAQQLLTRVSKEALLVAMIAVEVMIAADFVFVPDATLRYRESHDLTDVFSAFVEPQKLYRPLSQSVIPYVFGADHAALGVIAEVALVLTFVGAAYAFSVRRYWLACCVFIAGLLCHEYTVALPFLLIAQSRKAARNTIPLFIILLAYGVFRFQYTTEPVTQESYLPRRGVNEVAFEAKYPERVSIRTIDTTRPLTTGYAQIDGVSGEIDAEVIVAYGTSADERLSVSTMRPIYAGTIDAEIDTGIRTSVAIVNPNATAATITFAFKESSKVLREGNISIPAKGQLAVFLDEEPFGAKRFKGSFTFDSRVPIAFVGLKAVTQKEQMRMSSLTVKSVKASHERRLIFPHFAFGGGYVSRFVIRAGASGASARGVLKFFRPSGEPLEIPIVKS